MSGQLGSAGHAPGAHRRGRKRVMDPARPAHGLAHVQFWFYTRLAERDGDVGSNAQPASNCWIYLFRQTHDAVAFTDEIRVDERGIYTQVNLAAHAGHDRRPAGRERSSEILLMVSETIRGEYRPIAYWILCSPFQLPWARLPDLGPKLQVKDGPEWNVFMKWARDERGLDRVWLDPTSTEFRDGVCIQYLWTPWHRAWAQSERLHAALDRREHELARKEWTDKQLLIEVIDSLMWAPSDKAEKKTNPATSAALPSATTAATAHGQPTTTDDRKPGPLGPDKVYACIDRGFFEQEKRNLERLAADLAAQVEIEAAEHTRLLDEPGFTSLVDDAARDPRPDAKLAAAVILDRAHDRLLETTTGTKHVRRFYDQHHDFVHSNPVSAFKTIRKGTKAWWSWMKMFVAFAEGAEKVKKGPKYAVFPKLVTRWASDFAGVSLLPEVAEETDPANLVVRSWERHPPGPGKLPNVVISRDSVAELKKKVSENPHLNGLMLLVDIVNLCGAVDAYLTHGTSNDADSYRKVAGVASATTSAVSSAIAVAVSTLPEKELTANLARLRALDAEGGLGPLGQYQLDKMQSLELRSPGAVKWGRVLRERAVKSVVGALLAFVSAVTDAADLVHQSRTGDLKTRSWTIVALIGDALAVAGYVAPLVSVVAAPLGPALILVGAILALGAGLGQALLGSSALEKWLRHCWCGKERLSGTSAEENWSHGPLSHFHESLQLQKLALADVFLGLRCQCTFRRRAPWPSPVIQAEIKVTFRRLTGCEEIALQCSGHGRAGWLWDDDTDKWRQKYRFEEGPGETVQFMVYDAPDDDIGEVHVRLGVDLLGDGSYTYPERLISFNFLPRRWDL